MRYARLWATALVAGSLAACGGGGTDVTASSALPEVRARKPMELVLAAEPVQRVNTLLAGEQSLRALGALADGGHALAWRTGESGWALQRYDASGAPVGGETPIAFAGLPSHVLAGAAAAVLPNGHVVLAYVDAREAQQPMAPPLLEIGVYVRRFDATGRQVQDETVVTRFVDRPHSRSPGFGQLSALALADGSFVVAWAFISPSSVTIRHTFFAQHFDASGRAVGAARTLGRPASPGTASYRLSADAWGGYSAALQQQDESYQPDHSLHHFGAQGSAIRLAPAAPGATLLALQGGRLVRFDQDAEGPYLQLSEVGLEPGPRIAISTLPVAARELADGRFAVLWPAGHGLRVQVFDSDATPLGPAVATAATEPRPPLAALGDGGLVLGWSAGLRIGDADVYAQRFIEAPVRANAARQAQWKSCLVAAKGLKGPGRKQFMDACSRE